jgi:hypothetical protein
MPQCILLAYNLIYADISLLGSSQILTASTLLQRLAVLSLFAVKLASVLLYWHLYVIASCMRLCGRYLLLSFHNDNLLLSFIIKGEALIDWIVSILSFVSLIVLTELL